MPTERSSVGITGNPVAPGRRSDIVKMPPPAMAYILNVADSENTRPFLYTEVGASGVLLYW
jgi:hypothetical protein